MSTTLYRFHDDRGRLLYIGVAGNPARRFEQHAHEKAWWPEVMSSTMELHPDRRSALTAERLAIKAEHPRHNIVHAFKPTSKPRRVERRHEVTWRCEVCKLPIANRKGYIESLRGCSDWHAYHEACDPESDSSSYWIAVERLRFKAKGSDSLAAWTKHLNGKSWFWISEWERFLKTQRLKHP